MSLWSFLKIFGSNPQVPSVSAPGPGDQLIVFLENLVVNKSQIVELTRRYEEAKSSNVASRDFLYVSLYFAFEEYLTRTKPPQVHQEHTKPSLRAEVAKNIQTNSLPQPLRLIFLPEKEQTFQLFEIATREIVYAIIRTIGVSRLQNLISLALVGTPLGHAPVTQSGIDFSLIYPEIQSLTTYNITSSFKTFYANLYREIIKSVGEKTTNEIFHHAYNLIRTSYAIDFTSLLVEVLPEAVLGEEKLSFLSREELEQKVAEAVSALRIEKESVERKVQERTQELKVSKENTEREKAKIEGILQSIADGVFAVDLEGKIILMNSVSEKLSGVGFAQARGRGYKEIFHFVAENKPQDAYINFVEEVIKTGQPKLFSNHTLLLRNDNTSLPISDSAAPIKDLTGAILGCIVVIRDASRERALEQAKDNFISIAAHQLRTPLGSMRWNLESLLSQNDIPEKDKEKITRIYQSNQRIIDLVNDLLRVSSVDQNRVQDNPEQTDLVAVTRAAAQELEPTASARRVVIDIQTQGQIPQVLLDPKLFREVVENLLSNAVKYNREGGRVTVLFAPNQNMLRISVKDEGIGIPKLEQDRVFTKFYRAVNAAKSDTTGTGLGLYVAKSYVERWGGKISFESIEGSGTTFYIDLPTVIVQTPEQNAPKTYFPEGISLLPQGARVVH